MPRMSARVRLPRNKDCYIFFDDQIEPSFGEAVQDEFETSVRLNPQQSDHEMLNTTVHEMLHQLNWSWGEARVSRQADIISDALRRLKFHRDDGARLGLISFKRITQIDDAVWKLCQGKTTTFKLGEVSKPKHWWWAACYKGRVVGFATFQQVGRAGALTGCLVNSRFHGLGIHRKLIQLREDFARRKQFTYMYAKVERFHNFGAASLLRSGFTLTFLDKGFMHFRKNLRGPERKRTARGKTIRG